MSFVSKPLFLDQFFYWAKLPQPWNYAPVYVIPFASCYKFQMMLWDRAFADRRVPAFRLRNAESNGDFFVRHFKDLARAQEEDRVATRNLVRSIVLSAGFEEDDVEEALVQFVYAMRLELGDRPSAIQELLFRKNLVGEVRWCLRGYDYNWGAMSDALIALFIRSISASQRALILSDALSEVIQYGHNTPVIPFLRYIDRKPGELEMFPFHEIARAAFFLSHRHASVCNEFSCIRNAVFTHFGVPIPAIGSDAVEPPAEEEHLEEPPVQIDIGSIFLDYSPADGRKRCAIAGEDMVLVKTGVACNDWGCTIGDIYDAIPVVN